MGTKEICDGEPKHGTYVTMMAGRGHNVQHNARMAGVSDGVESICDIKVKSKCE